jgi:hypothetical protein
MCSTDPKRSANSSQGICGYISLKFTDFLNQRNNVLLKIIAEFL